jgi:hypothetical protein
MNLHVVYAGQQICSKAIHGEDEVSRRRSRKSWKHICLSDDILDKKRTTMSKSRKRVPNGRSATTRWLTIASISSSMEWRWDEGSRGVFQRAEIATLNALSKRPQPRSQRKYLIHDSPEKSGIFGSAEDRFRLSRASRDSRRE